MAKHLGRALTSSDTPLWYLYEQGVAWENLRAVYFARYGYAQHMHDAMQRAEHYRRKWEELPETAHRSQLPRYF